MKKYFISTLILFALVTVLFSCEKEPGPGGKATVHVQVIKAEENAPYATVKIKYGATSFPGEDAIYDETKICDYLAGCSFENLQRGDYYFYATYVDTVQSDTVWQGGIHVRIADKKTEMHTVIDFIEADPF